ncbi:MAG: acyltransferase family protein [Ilumatobacteraceae bacterium]
MTDLVGRSILGMHGDDRAATSTRPATGYLPGLDGLRAISVVAVLLYHAEMPWLPGGFLGVEVFFVISGYLITMLLVREFERSSTISLRTFWTRRARRLLAAVYVLLASVSAAVLLFYREDASTLAGQVWAALAYVTNWFLIVTEQSYFAAVERPPVFQHLWSLAIEEQFYLLWPLLLLGLLRLFRGRPLVIAGVITAGAIASFVWMAVLFEPAMDPSRAYYGTDTRASGLLLGAALAILWKPNRTFRGDAEVKSVSLDLVGMGAVAVLVCCFATMRDTDSFLYRGGFAVVSVASCAAIMATVHGSTVLGRHVLSHPVLIWIGVRSYSLYLWHWPIFVYTRPEIDQPMTRYPTLVLRLALTVLAAELSYRYVEVPIRNGAFRRWRTRLARRHGARRVAGPVALASVAGLLLVAVSTVSATDSSSEEELLGQGGSVPAATSTTTPAATTPVEGVTGAGSTPSDPAATPAAVVAATTTVAGPTTTLSEQDRTVTVLGDSVLLGAQDTLTSELQGSGYIVDYRAHPALMLHQSNNDLIGANTPVGSTVIVGLGHNSLWEKDRVDYDNWAAKFDREADALITTLESLGAKKIVWVTLREPSESVIPPEGRKQYQLYVWYFPYVNERLRLLPERHPDVVLADWAAVSNDAGLTYDAMHLTASGIRLMIDTIRTAGGI